MASIKTNARWVQGLLEVAIVSLIEFSTKPCHFNKQGLLFSMLTIQRRT